MITIDGSQGEGGGQVLRTAIALSAVSGTPVTITNIRKGRPNPGLAAQHLAGIRLVSQLTNGTLEGAVAGSMTVTFTPGQLIGGNYEIDVGTAGAITLVLQAALLPALFCEKQVKLRLTGGTDVPWSPPLDYLHEVTLPAIAAFGAVQIKLEKRGYYPAGQGVVEVTIKGRLARGNDPWPRFCQMLAAKHPAFVRSSRPALQRIKGVAYASVPGAAAGMAEAARFALTRLGAPVDIRIEESPTASPGGGITLWGVFSEDDEVTDASPRVGASGLLDGRKTDAAASAKAGAAAASALIEDIRGGTPVDCHLADQLITFLSLCGSGRIVTSKVTTHTTTAIAVCRQMLGCDISVNGMTITKV
jgi:RNA 3'-terminal phosphate cyclase (GTP)